MFDIQVNSDQTINTLELRKLVNEARGQANESKIRNDQFVSRIEDELGGELGECKSIAHPQSGVSMVCYDLTIKQAMLVGMRESKSVRRAVVAKLEDLQSVVQQPTTPSTTESYFLGAKYLVEAMNLRGSSVLDVFHRTYKTLGLDTSALPQYAIDAPSGQTTSSEVSFPITDLLEKYGYTLDAQQANRLLVAAGFLETRTRKTTTTKSGYKSYKAVTPEGNAYGINKTNPNNTKETQPHWFDRTFVELMDLIGVEQD